MNVLIIFSDQQHKEALGKVNPQYITPNLDRLCNEGILFKNAYTPNPVCGPFRGCFFTGQYTSHCDVRYNGETIQDDALQMAEMMHNNGYSTSYIGKCHLGGEGNLPVKENQRKGIEKAMVYQCYNGFRPEEPYNNEVVFFDENNKRYEFSEHRTDVTTNLAISALKNQLKDERPFFCTISYQAPHYPEQPLDEYYEMYKNTKFKLSDDYIETDPYTEVVSPRFWGNKEDCQDYKNYSNNMMQYMRYYAGMCTQIDSGVGRIFELLKEKGVYDDTLIIYTSDHGDMQGSRGLTNKGVPYERSCGVPMIIKYPNGRQNDFSEELISSLDIFATLSEIVDDKNKSQFDGESILRYLQGKDDKTHDYVISEYMVATKIQWRMIRNRNFKYITNIDYSPRELYDMTSDYYEQNNLVNNPNYAQVIENLSTILKARTKEITPRPRKPIELQKGMNKRD